MRPATLTRITESHPPMHRAKIGLAAFRGLVYLHYDFAATWETSLSLTSRSLSFLTLLFLHLIFPCFQQWTSTRPLLGKHRACCKVRFSLDALRMKATMSDTVHLRFLIVSNCWSAGLKIEDANKDEKLFFWALLGLHLRCHLLTRRTTLAADVVGLAWPGFYSSLIAVFPGRLI